MTKCDGNRKAAFFVAERQSSAAAAPAELTDPEPQHGPRSAAATCSAAAFLLRNKQGLIVEKLRIVFVVIKCHFAFAGRIDLNSEAIPFLGKNLILYGPHLVQ